MKDKALHYVNNKMFSTAVVEYVSDLNQATAQGHSAPRVTEYIGHCFLKIATGLSHKPNFACYTYREEMVMDGVENCLKAIGNYDITKSTRSGSPNAFAYFTQICYYAFLRRIIKEKKQQDIKLLYMQQANIQSFASFDDDDHGASIIERVRIKTDAIHERDQQVKIFAAKVKAEKKVKTKTNSVGVESFL